MNLIAILSERQSSKNVKQIAAAAIEDDHIIKELLRIMDKGEARLSQNAAWPISHITDANPKAFIKHQKELLALLRRTDVHAAVHRNVIRVFHFLKVDEKLEAELLDICFHFLNVRETPIAVKHWAIHIILILSKKYPDLINELKAIIKILIAVEEAPAYKYVARKLKLI
jgi:hypothetical protein